MLSFGGGLTWQLDLLVRTWVSLVDEEYIRK